MKTETQVLKPVVELKNVKTFRGHDGVGLDADLWINGLKCAHVFDPAMGGQFEYQTYDYKNPRAKEIKANMDLLDEYIKTIPERIIDFNGVPYMDKETGKPMTMKVDLDEYINDILEEQEKAKYDAKFKREKSKFMEYGFLYGDPKKADKEYKYVKYSVMLSTFPVETRQKIYDLAVARYVKGNVVILNTNLKELGIKI